MNTSVAAPAAEVRALTSRDRYSPHKSPWVYHVEAGRVTLYRMATEAGADALVRLLDGRPGHAARTLWPVNLWHASRQMGVRGWLVGMVVE